MSVDPTQVLWPEVSELRGLSSTFCNVLVGCLAKSSAEMGSEHGALVPDRRFVVDFDEWGLWRTRQLVMPLSHKLLNIVY